MSGNTERKIHGVDFSGAQDAGEKIWISSGRIEDEELVIEECRSAADEFGRKDRRGVLERLRSCIASSNESVFGLDFSFGIPIELVDTDSWEEFVRVFSKYTSAQTMQEEYSEQARRLPDKEGVHLKRRTDEKRKASSPYGFITRSQTYHGLRDVLAPLVHDDSISVLPMQSAEPDRPWALEIYPAVTLDSLNLHREGYKDNTVESRERRMTNVEGLANQGIQLDEEMEQRAVCTDDALDSLVAAFSTFRAMQNDPSSIEDERSMIEGHIYV